jgi:hypothetical protein
MATLPSADELNAIEATLQPYFLALGKVAHSWNHLHEELGKIFCAVTQLDLSVGMAAWHGLRSDRGQRQMLEAAIKGAAESEDWVEEHPGALEGVIWLINRVNCLSGDRNNAIHAPCHALPGLEDFEIKPITFFGNRLARKLQGKDILQEFSWYEQTADILRRHATDVRFALDAQVAWPERPALPKREA